MATTDSLSWAAVGLLLAGSANLVIGLVLRRLPDGGRSHESRGAEPFLKWLNGRTFMAVKYKRALVVSGVMFLAAAALFARFVWITVSG